MHSNTPKNRLHQSAADNSKVLGTTTANTHASAANGSAKTVWLNRIKPKKRRKRLAFAFTGSSGGKFTADPVDVEST
jgi:SET domain-containing protein